MLVLGLLLIVAGRFTELSAVWWIGVVLAVAGAATSLASLLTDGQAGR